ncbi:MAG: polysaccharide biosynthesis/export family protein [Candidatus Omnitrophica bacterium]|nr:polysaccharide biosynthesis/export family protein [Candidatus Omnitrophota bacterium]
MSLGLFLSLYHLGTAPPLQARLELEAPTYRDRGYQAQQKGQLELAMQHYQKAIAIDPQYATPHNDLGILYEKQGKSEEAESEYLKAVSLDPHFLDAYANLALLYEKAGKKEKAVLYWRKRIDYGHPNDPWTRKAMERLGSLSKEEIVVSYPPLPAQEGAEEERLSLASSERQQRKPWGRASIPFQGIPTEFEEFGAPPTDLYYSIGPGDALEISVWQQPELTRTVTVRPDGRVSFPLVDDVYVSGLTPQQVDVELTRRLSNTLRTPTVTVIMTGFGSRGVYVLGEVRKPGRYPLPQPRTAVEMISEAGQWLDSGVLTSVLVVRRGWSQHPHIYRVNLAQVVTQGNTAKDMVLQNGDVVFIPRNFVKKLDNFLFFFTKHLRGSLVGGSPFVIGDPVELR